MSKHVAGIALLLALAAFNTNAEAPDRADEIDFESLVVTLGSSDWAFFRPSCREQTLFDLEYLTNDLRSQRAGLGLRFHSSSHLTLDLEIDPFTKQKNLIGPVYDFGIGATVLALRVSF